ncbi:MAG TPA: hypothetical protein VFH50_08920 [Acidimicrobiales bacterium]|nr:hypothetical protein [Acidimicrobiales bacterium]
MTSAAELSSILTGLEEITKRVTAIADSYAAERREDLAGDLYAVERQLVNAGRRLGKAADAAAR